MKRHQQAWSAVAALVVALALLVAKPALGAQEQTDPYADAAATTLADGTYEASASLEGGSGRAGIASPVTLSVRDGRVAATVTWSSPNYDYMVVANKTYLPTNQTGNSTFVIPVLALDEPFEVVGDTTAMSQPHEIRYRLTIDSGTAVAKATASAGVWAPVAVAVGVAAGTTAFVLAVRRRQR